MARNSKRVALYEVISRASPKSVADKTLKTEPSSAKESVSTEIKTDIWSARPRIVRVYNDRIEFCFSWQLFVIVVLVLVAMLLVFYRLGRSSASNSGKVKVKEVSTELIKPVIPRRPEPSRTAAKPISPAKMVEPMGDNVIVITSYGLRSHLQPVKEYYSRFGIETQILNVGDRYLLITQERFDNPGKVGTDGYEAKKKIIAIGANYKPTAGSGFESFGKKPFHDAYGMKLK